MKVPSFRRKVFLWRMTTAGITGKLKEKIRETKTTKIQNFNWKLAKAFTLQNIKWFEGTYLFQGAKKFPPSYWENITWKCHGASNQILGGICGFFEDLRSTYTNTNKDYLPFLRSSGLPFLTVANTISPTAAAGRRFKRPLIPLTAIMYKFLAPEIEIFTNI